MSNNLSCSSVYIHSGEFDTYGGWVLDTQFIPIMGSEYLLAHGLGEPVEDAFKKVKFPKTGTYKLWVRTKDWVAPWKKGVSPGVFTVKIDNQELPHIFGNQEQEWHWQDGGIVNIDELNKTISLHDLTGFEGRCGSLFFTTDLDLVPPNDIGELKEFIQNINDSEYEEFLGKYDIVVAGAGIAGICGALSAARNGLCVALVQDREVVGGNNSSEVRVWLGGKTNFEPYPNIGNIVNELEQERLGHYGEENIGEIYEDDKKFGLLQVEKNITIFTGYAVCDAKMQDDCIKQAVLYNVKNGRYYTIEADMFMDSTGDGELAFASGADFETTTNGHMGITNMWHVKNTHTPQSFADCSSWGIDLSNVDFPGRKDVKSIYNQSRESALGGWFWESGMEHDPIKCAEYARDTNLRAMYSAWHTIKNIDNDYTDYKLGFCAYIGGKRESRRFFGDIILTKCEVYNGVNFDDGCVPSTWNFDVHYPDKRFYAAFHEGDGFLTRDYHEGFKTPYFIPYRCFYSRNVRNLFLAGRNISVSHDALGTVRVMRTGGMMGEVIGKAAAICKKYNVYPRDVYNKHLDEFVGKLKD